MFHPDSSIITLRKSGYQRQKIIILAIIGSSLGTLFLYLFNQTGLDLINISLGVNWINWIRLKSTKLVLNMGYLAIVILSFIPFIPFCKEAGMLAGQIIGLEYALLVMLATNAVRIVVIFLLAKRINL